MERPISDRMAEALAKLEKSWGGRRQPKAFYLGPDDWDEFIATEPASVRAPWGNNPTIWQDEPGFQGVPVRASKNVAARRSHLYDQCGYGRSLPDSPEAPAQE